jgi:hypothetical protein
MKRIVILIACFTTMLAISAGGATSAFALPEFVSKSNPDPLVATGGKMTLVSGSALTVVCEDSRTTGVIVLPMLVSVDTNFLLCHSTILGTRFPCTTAGAPSELILTSLLHGLLGYIKKGGEAGKEVGLLLSPTSPTTVLMTFTCKASGIEHKIVVSGAMIGQLTPINVSAVPYALTFKAEPAGSAKQGIQTFELLSGLPTPLFMEKVHLTASIDGGAPLETSREDTDTMITRDESEIKA